MASNGATRVLAGAAHLTTGKGERFRGGLFVLNPEEGQWRAVTAGLPPEAEVRALAVHPHDNRVVYAGTQDGPYRTIDGGEHWQRLSFPERGAVIWSLAIHPTQPQILYAGTAPVALYRSLDGGDTWHRLTQAVSPAHCERAGFDTRVIRITVDPSRPDDVYAALEVSGVLRSADRGETWTDLSAPLIKFAEQPHLKSNVGGRHCGDCEGMLDSHALAISKALPGVLFLAIRMGLFRSDDRGATWYDTKIGRFSPLTYCRDVIVSPHDARVMYTCISPAAVSNDGTLYRSEDLGQSWQRIDRGVKADSTMMAVDVHPRDPRQIFCISRGGQVFGTQDAGASWREYRLPSEVRDAYAVASI